MAVTGNAAGMPSGVFALDWDDTEIDGTPGLGPEWLRPGAEWRWSGDMVRLDGVPNVLTLDDPSGQETLRARAAGVAPRLCGSATLLRPDPGIHTAPSQGFCLTDGVQVFTARMIDSDKKRLVVFSGGLPPQHTDLWVLSTQRFQPGHAQRQQQSVICFAAESRILTPSGPQPIDQLKAGDLVVTRDNGPQPVMWIGRSALAGAALRRHPQLRPIRLRSNALGPTRPDEDLRVSPAHRLLISGAKAQALFGCDEVLVRAGDLVDHVAICPDLAQHGVTYVHLLLESHQIIFANGVASESFHPADAPAATLRDHRRDLRAVIPDVLDDPVRYGATARRCLTRGEASLLAA